MNIVDVRPKDTGVSFCVEDVAIGRIFYGTHFGVKHLYLRVPCGAVCLDHSSNTLLKSDRITDYQPVRAEVRVTSNIDP